MERNRWVLINPDFVQTRQSNTLAQTLSAIQTKRINIQVIERNKFVQKKMGLLDSASLISDGRESEWGDPKVGHDQLMEVVLR